MTATTTFSSTPLTVTIASGSIAGESTRSDATFMHLLSSSIHYFAASQKYSLAESANSIVFLSFESSNPFTCLIYNNSLQCYSQVVQTLEFSLLFTWIVCFSTSTSRLEPVVEVHCCQSVRNVRLVACMKQGRPT